MTEQPKRRVYQPPPEGWMKLRQYCIQHGIPYSLIYSRMMLKKTPYIRKYNHWFVPADLDPTQFARSVQP
jgi:hypothetical protein